MESMNGENAFQMMNHGILWYIVKIELVIRLRKDFQIIFVRVIFLLVKQMEFNV
jgi:hypothetical protein